MARQKRTCGSSPAGRGKGSAWAGVWSARTAPAGNVLNNKTTRKPVPTRIGLHRPLRCCRARDSQLGACYQSASRRVKPGRAFCLALAVLGSLADGCGEALPPPGTLVVAFDSDPDSLDPRFQTDANGARLADLLYAGLTRADAAGRRIPELARTWEMADSRSFVFRLRPDFRFPDGTAVTAADVKATYDAVRDPALASPKRAALATLSAIEAPDPTTVVMRLTEPFAPLLDATGLGILPAARAREAGDVTTGAAPVPLLSAVPGGRPGSSGRAPPPPSRATIRGGHAGSWTWPAIARSARTRPASGWCTRPPPSPCGGGWPRPSRPSSGRSASRSTSGSTSGAHSMRTSAAATSSSPHSPGSGSPIPICTTWPSTRP